MINKDEIDRAILEHEAKDTTYANCERLAWLYIVRDHISGQAQKQPVALDISGDSDFMKLINGKDSVKVFSLIDELMTSIRIIQPNLYTAVIQKIQEI